ncbi:Heterogeneous nuclear ribonucleoprotein L [Exaiptasia diaphana]|nr:Heterogeneous nuclear ribonucleoprotein L [Exaiptasia diaphana]
MAEKHAFEETSGYASNEYSENPYKRARVDNTLEFTGYQGRHYAEPSRVVHIRGVADEATEQDILQSFGQFGKIACITMMPKIRQALVEFEDIRCATNLVQETAAGNPVILCGRQSFANYSKSQHISRNVQVKEDSPPNHILLVTIINPQYPVTTDILHTIFSKQGAVQRIVVFRKSGLQAMIEHSHVMGTNLQCPNEDKQSYIDRHTHVMATISQCPSEDYKSNIDRHSHVMATISQCPRSPPMRKQGLLSPPPTPPMYGGGHGVPSVPAAQPPMYHPPSSGGCVLMVYGMDKDKMNCDRLFNLLCCYGNVMKIKFLLGKLGTAMAELNDHVACNTVIEHLSGIELFGSRMDFGYSKQSYLVDPTNIPNLADGTPSFKSYAHSKNHRFISPAASSKNRVFSPTKVLHFFNAPADADKTSLEQMCIENGVSPPIAVKVFTPAARSASGLMEWETGQQALEALVLCNHFVVKNDSAKTIYTVKLAFSSTPTAQ